MAVITSAQSGNFSAPATWVGGVVPTSVDDAVAATGHVVTIDVDVTITEFRNTTTGYFLINAARTINGNIRTTSSTQCFLVTATTTFVLNGNVIAENQLYAINFTGAGITATINGNIFSPFFSNTPNSWITINATSATLNVVGNITGPWRGTGGITSASNNVTVNVTGNVSGGAEAVGSGGYGVQLTGGASVVNITGSATGGPGATGSAVFTSAATSTVTVTGVVTGGSALNAHGVYTQGASSTVNVIGSIVGGSAVAHGVRSDATSNGVIFQGDMTDSPQGAVAVSTRIFRMTATNNGVTKYANTVGYPNGTLVSRVSPNQITGMPAASNVRKNTVYGYNNELTGTCAIPPANAVSAGVAVDNTTGTAVLTTGSVASLIGAQIAAAVTTPVVN